MNAARENLLVLGLLVAFATAGAVVVGALSSETLRQQGLRRLMKRWLGR